jgi:hypothetical protein
VSYSFSSCQLKRLSRLPKTNFAASPLPVSSAETYISVALRLHRDTHSWPPDKVAAVPYLTLPYFTLHVYVNPNVTFVPLSEVSRPSPDITPLRISDERFTVTYKGNNTLRVIVVPVKMSSGGCFRYKCRKNLAALRKYAFLRKF